MSSVGTAHDLTPPVTNLHLPEPARYIVGEPLAQGGMSQLFAGKRIAAAGVERPVVLKRLLPDLAQSSEARALFLREAALMARLDHPAIVRMLDLADIDGTLFLVLESVRGGDLRLLLRRVRRRGRRFSTAAALYLGRELCSALDYAHRLALPDGRTLGLVHRDVSPANILLSVEGEVKLSDFGIAEGDPALGAAPRARGQVGYMSPEQARGDVVDARSDLFSLAAVLYEIVTNRRLFVGQVGQSQAEIYGEPIVPPSRISGDLPRDMDALLLHALALSQNDRPSSARALYEELLEVSKRQGLWMDRAELSAELRELCGPDPAQWATLEERTATALISPLAVLDDGAMDGPGESRDALIDGAMALHTVPATADEPSGSMITVPWPTVGGAGEYDLDEDTLTWRSRERGRSTSRAAMGRPPATRIAPSPSSTPTLPKPKLDTDSDPEAVTKPAERASPEEALAPSLPPFDGMAAPPVLPPALTTGRRQKAVRRPRGRWGGLALTDRGSLLLWILVIGATVWLVLKWRTNHLGF